MKPRLSVPAVMLGCAGIRPERGRARAADAARCRPGAALRPAAAADAARPSAAIYADAARGYRRADPDRRHRGQDPASSLHPDRLLDQARRHGGHPRPPCRSIAAGASRLDHRRGDRANRGRQRAAASGARPRPAPGRIGLQANRSARPGSDAPAWSARRRERRPLGGRHDPASSSAGGRASGNFLQPGQTVVAEGVELANPIGKVIEVGQIGSSRDQLNQVQAPPGPGDKKGRRGPPPA